MTRRRTLSILRRLSLPQKRVLHRHLDETETLSSAGRVALPVELDPGLVPLTVQVRLGHDPRGKLLLAVHLALVLVLLVLLGRAIARVLEVLPTDGHRLDHHDRLGVDHLEVLGRFGEFEADFESPRLLVDSLAMELKEVL